MFWLGKIDGTGCPFGVENNKYNEPVAAAKHDWIVLRTIENVKRSVDTASPLAPSTG